LKAPAGPAPGGAAALGGSPAGAAEAVGSYTRPFLVVALLALVLFINYVDRGAVPTAVPLIQHDLNLDNEQVGRLLSAFFWVYAFIQVPVGWLAERYGAHRILAAGLIIWAAATMLVGVTSSFAMLLALRMLLGLGESAGFPCVSKLMAAVVPIEKLGRANGIVGFAYLMAPGIGIFAAGRLIDHVGWRGTFVTFGLVSLLWLVPWVFVKLPKLATARADAATPTWSLVVKQKGLWGTSLGLFSSNYMWYFMLSWMPGFLVKERGFSMHEMEYVGTLGYLVNGLSALAIGYAIDRYIAPRTSANFAYKLVMVVAHVGAVPCMLGMALGTQDIAVASMFGFQVLMGASSPGVYAMSQILAGPRASGRWVGIQNSVGNISGGISPWLTGFIVDRTGHFTLAFMACAIVSLAGLIGWIGLVPRLVPIPWERLRRPDPAAA
jgi:MFS family permease